MDRIAQLKGFIEKKPDDPFPRYALALERRGQGDLAGAIEELESLLARASGYVPAYLHLGMLLQQTGRVPDARAVFERGQVEARKQGNTHALGEITSALEALP